MSPWALSPADLRRRPDSAPMVLLGEQDAGGLLDHVAMDNVAAARDATRHLIASGRTRIAAIGLQPHLLNGTAARRAGRDTGAALAEAGLPPRRDSRGPGRAAAPRGRRRRDAHLLDRATEADAVFCFSDQLALGALHAAWDAACGSRTISRWRASTTSRTAGTRTRRSPRRAGQGGDRRCRPRPAGRPARPGPLRRTGPPDHHRAPPGRAREHQGRVTRIDERRARGRVIRRSPVRVRTRA